MSKSYVFIDLKSVINFVNLWKSVQYSYQSNYFRYNLLNLEIYFLCFVIPHRLLISRIGRKLLFIYKNVSLDLLRFCWSYEG